MASTDLAITGKELASYVVYRGPHSYDFALPTIGQLYDYLLAGNGVFIHARKPGLNICFQISEAEVRGLAPLESWTNFTLARVPVGYLQKMLELSIGVCVEKEEPTETLFHLIWMETDRRWRLDKPAQTATGGSVKPLDDGDGSSYQLATIEVHSHHQMTAFFSGQDDADEQGFRIYGVIGEIFTEPKLRVRVGCFGQFFEIPAETIFELPTAISDAHEEENEIVETR
jgi:PRTRC genetic system protein A